jgi:hypothetical protein
MIILFLLLFGSVDAIESPCGSIINATGTLTNLQRRAFYDWSIDRCTCYSPCAHTFRLDGSRVNERKHFEHQLKLLMFENDVNESVACQSELLWSRLMANFWPCSVNEVYDSRLGCTCAKEKQCHEKPPNDFDLSKIVYWGIGIFVTGALIYYGKKSISNQKKEKE